MAKLSPVYVDAQFINSIAANGAKVFTYAAGSSTKQATYTDSTGLTAQANPIILNSRGEPASPIWLTEGLSYKFVFAPSTDSDPPVSPIRTIDNVTGVNDTGVTTDQWVISGITPTYVSATQFTLPGDQTSSFTVGRRIKATVTAGTVYGTISVSAYAALTTVTLVMDAGQVLDSGLSAVSYGIITPTSSSLPFDLSASNIQVQKYTAFTTGGTSTAYTLTPTPAITANTTNQRFNVTLNAAPGASPTLAVSGQTAKNFKYYDAIGTKQFITSVVAPSGWNSDVIYDGTDWVMQTVSKSVPSMVQLNTANGWGSTNTAIRRFTNVATNQGADITYADSATLGATFTINNSGVYAISYSDGFTTTSPMGLSVNSNQLTTSIATITVANLLIFLDEQLANSNSAAPWTGYLASGSVVRAHTATGLSGAGRTATFTITRVA